MQYYLPRTGTCSGCTNNPTGTITFSTANQKACYSGSSTITNLTFNANNDTVYICGNITVTNLGGFGSSPVIVVNSGKTLTITNDPSGNFWQNFKFVSYGTLTFSSSFTSSGLSSGFLITASATAKINIPGSLNLTGGTIFMNGGIINVSGTTTFNSTTGGTCLQSNAILNTVGITNNVNSSVVVPSGGTACISYTGAASITTNYLSSSNLNVCAGTSASGTSTGSSAWGPHTTVSSGCTTYSCAIILPVNFGDFSVSPGTTKAFLGWTTYSENKADQFEIQRSIDGIHFTTIGTITA